MVFLLALAVRLIVAVVLGLVGLIHDVAPDSALYVRLAHELANGRHEHWNAADRFYGDHWAFYLLPVSALFQIFGPHVILAQFVTATFAAVAAAITTRLALEVLPKSWAVGVGTVVALFPSLVLWSSVPLRDSVVWALTACMALLIVLASRARTGLRLAWLGLALGVTMYFTGELRAQALAIAAIALVIQALFGKAHQRLAVIGMSIGLAVVVPMLAGLGPSGIDYVENRDLGAIRVANAQGAESALESRSEIGDGGGIAHLPDGLEFVFVEPLPWTTLHGETVTLGIVESPLWWALVLAAFSAAPLLWKRRRVIGFPVLYAVGVAIVLALAEGNFGTLYRHRGELVAPFALLGGVGVKALYDKHSKRSAVAVAESQTSV